MLTYLIKEHKKFLSFTLIAGIGWILDMFIFAAFTSSGLRPLLANVISATCGLAFSYSVSTRYIFFNNKQFLFLKFLIYLIANVLSVLVFSSIIDAVTIHFVINPVLVKCCITPLTLLTNFIILSLMNNL